MGARRRLVILVALTGVFLASVPSAASAAGEQVEFVGSGWGHGVGMSQWGAQGQAAVGRTYDQILAHYYQGTALTTLSPQPNIWVNLEEKFANRNLTVLNTDVHQQGVPVKVQGKSSTINAQPGAVISLNTHGGSRGCRIRVTQPGGAVAEFEENSDCGVDLSWDGNIANPSTKILIQGCFNTDWNASGSPSVPCQYARGVMHLRGGTGGLYLSAEMPLDEYVKGISEIPYTWHAEVQKAQAVAARTYARSRSLARGVPNQNDYNGCWCQVRDTTADQRYVGWGHSNRTAWVNGTNATAGKVVTYQGSVITAYYSSSTGGRTEHGHLKGFASSPVAWLTSVDDHWAVDGTVPNPNASWVKSLSAGSVAQKVGFDAVTSVKVTATRPGSGSADEVRIQGIVNGEPVSAIKTSEWARQAFALKSEYFAVNYTAPPGAQLSQSGDELLHYKTNGTFRYNSVHANGVLGVAISSGSNYTSGWKSIDALDLNGDGRDEIMFYRDDGLYRYYRIGADGMVGSPLEAGDNYTKGWDSITAVDLDGDGRDEIFFYRKDGLYRYYDITASGRIGAPIKAGNEYTKGWDSITAVDLDGDGRDEMFFYREDGLYRYYDVRSNGVIGSPIQAGNEYTKGWDSITAVDLDGDGQDEMFFYRNDGLFRFYDARPNGTLGSPIRAGSNFGTGWSIISTINLDGK